MNFRCSVLSKIPFLQIRIDIFQAMIYAFFKFQTGFLNSKMLIVIRHARTSIPILIKFKSIRKELTYAF